MSGRSSRTTAAGTRPSGPALRLPDDLPRLVPGAAAAVAVAGLGLADGGIAPPAWGWAGLGLAAVAVAALAFRLRVRLSRLELAFLGALGLVAAWAALSAAWSRSLPSSVLESQRLLVYAAAAAAFLLAGRRTAAGPLLVGTLAGILVVAVANLLLRDGDAVTAAGQARPLADEHALAILLVLGVVIALGLALATTRPPARIGAAAAAGFLLVPLVPLGSGGAWLALVAGLVAAGALRFGALAARVPGRGRTRARRRDRRRRPLRPAARGAVARRVGRGPVGAARGHRRGHVSAHLAPAAERRRAGGRRAQRLPRDPGGGRPAGPGAARGRARGARRGRRLGAARAARPRRSIGLRGLPRARGHRPGLGGAGRGRRGSRRRRVRCSCSRARAHRRRSSARACGSRSSSG